MVGFKELLRRLQIQEQMTKQHQTRVDVSLCQLVSKCKKKKLAQGYFCLSTKEFWNSLAVSKTEYTDVLAMIDASRVNPLAFILK